MGDTDEEPDPSKRVPTVLWLMLGLILVVVFAAAVFALGDHRPRAVGPPAGAPPSAGQA
jgi:hypothetical protein